MRSHKIIVPGIPASKKNNYAVSGTGHLYKNKHLTDYETGLQLIIKSKVKKLTGPIAVAVGMYKRDNRRFDVDNALTTVMDCMNVIPGFDDHQVVMALPFKLMGTGRDQFTMILIMELEHWDESTVGNDLLQVASFIQSAVENTPECTNVIAPKLI